MNSMSSNSLDSIETESADSAISLGTCVSSSSISKTNSSCDSEVVDSVMLNTTESLTVTDHKCTSATPPPGMVNGEGVVGVAEKHESEMAEKSGNLGVKEAVHDTNVCILFFFLSII